MNKAYRALQRYLAVKQKELDTLTRQNEFIDEYEKMMFDDVYRFCKEYENEIVRDKQGIIDKIKQIRRILKS